MESVFSSRVCKRQHRAADDWHKRGTLPVRLGARVEDGGEWVCHWGCVWGLEEQPVGLFGCPPCWPLNQPLLLPLSHGLVPYSPTRARWADSAALLPPGGRWGQLSCSCPAGEALSILGGFVVLSPAERRLPDPDKAIVPLEYICISGLLLTDGASVSLKASVKILWSVSLSPRKSHYK